MVALRSGWNDTRWYQDRLWEVYDGLPDLAPQLVGQIHGENYDLGIPNTLFRDVKTYWVYESWRSLGFEDDSDNWGENVDLHFSVTQERSLDVGVDTQIELLRGIEVGVNVTASLTTSAAAEQSYQAGPAEDTKFRIKAFIKHRQVVEVKEMFKSEDNGATWQFVNNQRTVLREGSILGSYDAEISKRRRYWLEPEALGALDVIELTN